MKFIKSCSCLYNVSCRLPQVVVGLYLVTKLSTTKLLINMIFWMSSRSHGEPLGVLGYDYQRNLLVGVAHGACMQP